MYKITIEHESRVASAIISDSSFEEMREYLEATQYSVLFHVRKLFERASLSAIAYGKMRMKEKANRYAQIKNEVDIDFKPVLRVGLLLRKSKIKTAKKLSQIGKTPPVKL